MALSPSSLGARAVNAATVDAIERARQAVGVRRTALFWLDDASSRLACVATAGADGSEGWLGQTLAAGLGMAGRAVREGRPVWTPDLLADARVPIAPWLRERLEAEGLRVVAAAPVRVDGAISGALGFLDGPGRTYDEPALQQLGRLADEVAERVTRTVREGP
jgi:GAF domain-containing protein